MESKSLEFGAASATYQLRDLDWENLLASLNFCILVCKMVLQFLLPRIK